MPAIHTGPQGCKEKNKARAGNCGRRGSVVNNCDARFFFLSNACVSTLIGREGEKPWFSALRGPAAYGTDKIEATSSGET